MSGFSGKTVVVADDSPEVRHALVATYKHLGFDVVMEAESGKPVLDYIQNNKVDLVSLDIIMPEMDGFEAYNLICERFPQQKVVLVSWLASDPRVLEKLKAEITKDVFVKKPVQSRELADKLAAILEVEPNIESPDSETAVASETPELTLSAEEKPLPNVPPPPKIPVSEHGEEGEDFSSHEDLDIPITGS